MPCESRAALRTNTLASSLRLDLPLTHILRTVCAILLWLNFCAPHGRKKRDGVKHCPLLRPLAKTVQHCVQSRRDCISQPRVATRRAGAQRRRRNELPSYLGQTNNNPSTLKGLQPAHPWPHKLAHVKSETCPERCTHSGLSAKLSRRFLQRQRLNSKFQKQLC